MRIYKTLHAHSNGKVQDSTSPTGWKRRAGVERVENPTAKRARDRVQERTVWEPCDAPEVWVYGSAREDGTIARGGTIYTIVEDVPEIAPFTRDEVEKIVRWHSNRYQTALFVLNGGDHQGYQPDSPADAFRLAADARDRVLALTGLDLDDTNVAFPYRLAKPNWDKPFEADFEVSTERSVPAFI